MAEARHIIVGDVHGMRPELEALVVKVGLTLDDTLVFVGDLVDKGPDSAGVVGFARSLREKGFTVVLVEGNHEEKHSRFRTALEKGGEKATKKFRGVEELASITEALSPEDVAFLDTAVPFHRIPEHGAVVLHGGVTGDMTELDATDKGLISRLLRTRHLRGKPEVKITVEFVMDHEAEGFDPEAEVTPDMLGTGTVLRKQVKPAGGFLSLGTEGPDDPFWAEIYDGRFGHVFFGHSPFLDGVKHFDHATGLDTGCVFGGTLTAAILAEGEETSFVSVPASGKFSKTFWED